MDIAILIGLMLLALLPTACLVWVIQKLLQQHSARENSWRNEKELLLNRAMSNNWSEFAQLSASMSTINPSYPTSEYEDRGLSDEVELSRLGDMTTDQIEQIYGEISG